MKMDLCAAPVLFSFYEGCVGSNLWQINKCSTPGKYHSFVVEYQLVSSSSGFKAHAEGKTSGFRNIRQRVQYLKVLLRFFP